MEAPSIDAPAADWLVYGDSLQTQGDPRGALIAISHAIAEGKATEDVRDAYLQEHAAALFGNAAGFVGTYRFDWQFCVPLAVRVRIGAKDGDHELVLLGAPIAQHLRAITLVGHTEGRAPVDLSPAMVALQTKRPPHLTKFSFVDERAHAATMLISRDFQPRGNLVKLSSIAPFFAIAEEVHLDVADAHQLELVPMVGPELRAFTLDNLRFSDNESAGEMLGRFTDLELPKLERLRLRLTETWFSNIPAETTPYLPVYSERYDEEEDEDGDPVVNRYETEADDGDNNGIDWAALDPLLSKLAKLPLKELGLTGFDTADSLLQALDRNGFAPSLETLDLSDSRLDDRHAAWIAAHPAKFSKLKRIVVKRTRLTEVGVKALRNLGPEVVFTPGAVSYRYVVGSE